MESFDHLPQSRPLIYTKPIDEASLIAERRKRREAIKAKYKGQDMSELVKTIPINKASARTNYELKGSVDRPQDSSE